MESFFLPFVQWNLPLLSGFLLPLCIKRHIKLWLLALFSFFLPLRASLTHYWVVCSINVIIKKQQNIGVWKRVRIGLDNVTSSGWINELIPDESPSHLGNIYSEKVRKNSSKVIIAPVGWQPVTAAPLWVAFVSLVKFCFAIFHELALCAFTEVMSRHKFNRISLIPAFIKGLLGTHF